MRDRITTHGFAIAAALALLAGPSAAQAPGAETQQAADTLAPGAAPATPAPAAAAAETRYTLTQVNGKALPVEVEKEWRCREEVTAGTLTLQGDRWRLELAERETCGDRTKEDRDTDDGVYRTEGGTLRFLDDDGRVEDDDDRDDLDDLRSGTRAGDGTLTVELADGTTRLVFRPEGR